jgi:hypothetical protein
VNVCGKKLEHEWDLEKMFLKGFWFIFKYNQSEWVLQNKIKKPNNFTCDIEGFQQHKTFQFRKFSKYKFYTFS